MNIAKFKNFVLGKLKNELSDQLTYHSVNHTLYVLKGCQLYIKRMHVPPHDAFLLRTAALMHDIGFTETTDNHEERSIKLAKEILPKWNYTTAEIEKISGMILATRIPQSPQTIPEKIICDSDLDYLGTDAFYSTGKKLYHELVNLGKISGHNDWIRLQVEFLKKHHYHTSYAKKYREPLKQKHLNEILHELTLLS